jgi:hypothetical protein
MFHKFLRTHQPFGSLEAERLETADKLHDILLKARACGLQENDYQNALELIQEEENVLALELIMTQLFELKIKINRSLYEAMVNLGNKMGIDMTKWEMLKKILDNS